MGCGVKCRELLSRVWGSSHKFKSPVWPLTNWVAISKSLRVSWHQLLVYEEAKGGWVERIMRNNNYKVELSSSNLCPAIHQTIPPPGHLHFLSFHFYGALLCARQPPETAAVMRHILEGVDFSHSHPGDTGHDELRVSRRLFLPVTHSRVPSSWETSRQGVFSLSPERLL